MKAKLISLGKPNNTDYEILLDQLSNSARINSIRTSTIPLVQYWKSHNKQMKKLFSFLKIEPMDYSMSFEYPTPSYKSNSSSMTDLMIQFNGYKIAIEAKYTEYVKAKEKTNETIELWNKGKTENKKKVFEHWLSILKPFLNDSSLFFNKVPIQFFHRCASACYENPGKAIVIYQIFYDSTKKKELDMFIESLKSAKNIMNPNSRLSIIIHAVNIELIVKEDLKSPFQSLKDKDIYKIMDEKRYYI